MADSREPTRVMLWTLCRSLSTVFTKCMSYVDDIQIINEPFNMANSCGPERIRAADGTRFQQIWDAMITKASLSTSSTGYDVNLSTYEWVQQLLEDDYPGKQTIFCKDFAFALRGKYDVIPKGYRHTFLIRDPRKVFTSAKKMWVKLLQDDSFKFNELPEYLMNTPKFGIGELYDLYQWIHEQGLEANPIIIDADDLQQDPGSILRQYCTAVDIPYSDDLLKWEAGADIVDTWKMANILEQANKLDEGGFYDVAFQSSQFLPPSQPPSREEIDTDLLPVIDRCMGVYNTMYEMRIKP